MKNKYFFILVGCMLVFLVNNVKAQSYLEIQNCKDIIVYYDDYSGQKGKTQELSYILEKELIANVWEKIEVVNSIKNTKTFTDLSIGNYRVSVIPSNTKGKRITKVFKDKMKYQKSNKGKYDVFVSNTVEVRGVENCDESLDNQNYSISSGAIKIYPNPVNTVLNIFYPEEQDGYVSIFNILQQKVKSQPLDKMDTTELDLTSLKAGVYIVCIYSNEQIIHSEKISHLGR